MDHRLSIIIPCYNCKSTLGEAIGSIYEQHLSIPFEIVIVDDCSTDGTGVVVENLSKEHSEIRYFCNKKNQGGGFTRNVAVEKSKGDLIFCLDGDDVLPAGMLQKMVEYMLVNVCDGVVFEQSVFFTSTKELSDKIDDKLQSFTKKSLPITFSDLFVQNGNCYLTLVNFLYTKEAFFRAGGYPVNHGFDTQGFGFRFLSVNNKTLICPGSYYYHRQNLKGRSYFDRVYEQGLLSINFYLIFEEFIYLFSADTISKIIKYDVFRKNKLGSDNFREFIGGEFKIRMDKIFLPNYREYLTEGGFDKYIQEHSSFKNTNELFVKAVYEYKKNNYNESFDLFQQISRLCGETSIIKLNLLRLRLAAGSEIGKEMVDYEAVKLLKRFFKKRKMYKNPSIVIKFLIRVKKCLNYENV